MPIAVDISNQIPGRLQNENIQIFSLQCLPRQIRERYELGQQQALLLHGETVHRGRIQILGNNHLAVVAPTLDNKTTPPDSHVLVTLTADKGRRFVLQAVIEKQERDISVLRILDPRLHMRFPAAPGHGLQFRPVPHETVQLLAEGEIRVVRTKVGLESERILAALERHRHTVADRQHDGAQASGTVIDTLAERGREKVAEEFLALQGKRPTLATLDDISLGGICLSFPRKSARSLANRMVYVDLSCPPAPTTDTASHTPLLHLQAFATVRRHTRHPTEALDSLHLMFLHQLPEAAANCFAGPQT